MSKITKSAIENLEFHLSEMKKQHKWYSKLPKFLYNCILPISPNLMFYFVNLSAILLLILFPSDNEIVFFTLIGGVSFDFLCMYLFTSNFIRSVFLSNFLFLNRKEYHIDYLDSLTEVECSLETLRMLTKSIEKEKLEDIINKGNGVLTYKDIFGKPIKEIYEEKEHFKVKGIESILEVETGKLKEIKKEKGLILLDSLYEENKL